MEHQSVSPRGSYPKKTAWITLSRLRSNVYDDDDDDDYYYYYEKEYKIIYNILLRTII